jgi:hypothetical protein
MPSSSLPARLSRHDTSAETYKSSARSRDRGLPLRRSHDNEELAPIHPGEVLLEDFITPLDLSQYRVAKEIGVPPRRINEIVTVLRRAG